MKARKILSIFLFVILIANVSAYAHINIYIDEKGEALFLGETDEVLILPEGIDVKKGEVIGRTTELTKKDGSLWTFSYFLEGAELNIIFPEGSQIKKLDRGEISLEGQRISVYVQDEINAEYVINEKNGFDYWLIFLIILIALIVIYFLLKGKIKPKNNKLDILKQTLSSREKKIIEKLEEVKEIKHSRLQRLLEIPKASFSRHIQELGKKGLIKRIGEGKNKLISLK